MNFKQLYERLIQQVSSDVNKSIDAKDKGAVTAATIIDMPIGVMMFKKITEFNDAVKKLCNFNDDCVYINPYALYTHTYTDEELISYENDLSNKHDGKFLGNFNICFGIEDANSNSPSPSIYTNIKVYYGQSNKRTYYEQGGATKMIEDSDIATSNTYIVYERQGETQAADFKRVYKINNLSGVVKLGQYYNLFELIKIMYDNRYEISNYYEIKNYVQSIDDIIEQDKGAYIDKFMIPLLEKNNYDYTIEKQLVKEKIILS
jgi:hypothetical protein